ncbi:MAG: sulfotransferase family protein [Acidimicrobiia bacterium]|nr:sulfotransferase family protein [Acidimicrobiia bacterium]MDH5521623.1 sulfotransferase family protein [Acidimicrobiia bacterium]
MTRRINIWSSPRNVSTAIMYSFRQRSDTTVVDEPLYAHYLAVTGRDHPGRDDVLATQSADIGAVVDDVILADYPTPVVFFKQMAKHLAGVDPSVTSEVLFGRCDNVILTRDPFDMLTSFQVRIPDADVDETGFVELLEILEHILDSGHEPIVLDSKLLLQNPGPVLRRLCERLDLPFDEAMMSWPAGPKPEDGAWARYWYDSVHRSTGWAPWKPKNATLLPHLQSVLDEVEPMYERLLPYCITG